MRDRILNARATGKANRFRSRSLGAAAATLTASAAAAPASAAIIYDLAVSYSPNAAFDLTGDAASTIELFTVTGMTGDLELGLEAGGGMMASVEFSFFNPGMGSPDYLTLHSSGETVDGSLAFSDQVYLVEDSVINPDWAVDTTGYAGFTFDLGSGPLYGWLQIHFDASGTDFTVQQWAYDDAGVPITVGTIPEPSVAILLGLGVAALAAAWKRGSGGAPDAVD
jgi:hypothetical protein